MPPLAEHLAPLALVGIGATLLTDAWSWLRLRAFGVPAPDWALVGRWFSYLARARFVHASMRAVAPVRGERLIGWFAHYFTGLAFAAGFVGIVGVAWLRDPTPWVALLFGLATVAAPMLVLQPGMGAGLAARRTPRPWQARLHSMATHLVFGLGLYLSAAGIRLFSST